MEDQPRSLTSIATSGVVAVDGTAPVVEQAARSVKWSMLYNAVPRLVTPFSTMILAALLSPADFGLVAVSTFVLALAGIVVEMGLGKAVIQRQENVSEAASLSFWMNNCIALALYGGLWLAAPGVASLYGNPEVSGVIRLSAAALPLMAMQTIPKAMMRRNMEFQSLFWVNTSYLIIQSISSVILAILGFKAWAIIWGQLIGLLCSVMLAWRLGRWRPQTKIDWSLLRPLLTFSTWVMASGFQSWLNLYADNAIAGLFLGMHSLGVYSLGFNVATIVPTFLVASLDDVAYPAFCKLHEHHEEVGRRLIQLQMLTAAVLFPLAFGLSAVASPLIHLLYGEKWNGLGNVISALAIMPGLSPIWSINQNAYQATGQPALWTKLAGLSLLLLIPALWLAGPYGLIVFVATRCVGAVLLPLGNVLFGARTLGIGIPAQLRAFAAPLFFSVIMYVSLRFLVNGLGPYDGPRGYATLLLIIMVGGLGYIVMVGLFAAELWNQLCSGMRRIVGW